MNTETVNHSERAHAELRTITLQHMISDEGVRLYRVSDAPDVVYTSKEELIRHRGLPFSGGYTITTLEPQSELPTA